jgi:hypothetical protein
VEKALKVIGISLGVVILALVGSGYYFLSNVCANTMVVSSGSPSGKWKVVLFERKCGATTGFSSQISLIDAREKLKNKSGNIYIAEGYPEGYALTWTSDNSVLIRGVKGRISKQEAELSGVQFSYE